MVSEPRWIIFLPIQCHLAVQELKSETLPSLIGPMARQNQDTMEALIFKKPQTSSPVS